MVEAGEDSFLIDANDYLVDCFRLARMIWADGYRPDFLVGLWRGGAPPGIVIQEFLRWKGHDPYHTAIRTQSLEGVLHGDGFDIKGFEHVIEVLQSHHRMLLVDDLYETGRTMYEVTRHLRREAGPDTPEVRIAVVYSRPHRRRYLQGPHYCLHRTAALPIFPHRLTAMNPEEIRAAEPDLYEILFSESGAPSRTAD